MIISQKKSKWVKQFKPQMLKGKPLNNNAAVEARYNKALQLLVQKMIKTTEKEIQKLYKSDDAKAHFTMDGSVASQARILINSLTKKFNEMFGTSAKLISERMVNDSDKSSKSSIIDSLKDVAGMTINTNVTSADLKNTMKSNIAQNVQLIKTIPQQYLDRVGGTVYRSITSGQGLKELMPRIEEYGKMTEKRAHRIALDQTRKAYNSINADRLTKIGIKEFEWVHTAGSNKPRQDHIEMDGNIYSFDDLPVIDENTGERGIPGQAINCRCIMRPIIKFDTNEL